MHKKLLPKHLPLVTVSILYLFFLIQIKIFYQAEGFSSPFFSWSGSAGDKTFILSWFHISFLEKVEKKALLFYTPGYHQCHSMVSQIDQLHQNDQLSSHLQRTKKICLQYLFDFREYCVSVGYETSFLFRSLHHLGALYEREEIIYMMKKAKIKKLKRLFGKNSLDTNEKLFYGMNKMSFLMKIQMFFNKG